MKNRDGANLISKISKNSKNYKKMAGNSAMVLEFFSKINFGIIGFFIFLISSVPIFSYYSFMDLKTKGLGGAALSSVYSNPALLVLQNQASVSAEYSDLFYGLDGMRNPVQGYYAPNVNKKSTALLLPSKKYGLGFMHNQLSSPLHNESRDTIFLARNLNDLVMTRFEESINAALSLNFYSIKFYDFPYLQYSDGASTYSFDLFFYSAFSDGIEYALAFKNLGTTDIGLREKERLPREFTFSASKKFTYLKLIFTYEDSLGAPDLSVASEYRIGKLNMYSALNSNYVSCAAGFFVKNRIEFLLGVSYPFLNDFVVQPEISLKYYFSSIGEMSEDKKSKMKEFYNKAYEAYVNKNFEEAIKNWQEVLKIDPSHELSKINIGKSLTGAKKHYFNLATQEYKKGNYEKAIEFWQKVLEIDPSHELSKEKIEKAGKMGQKEKVKAQVDYHYLKGVEYYQVEDFANAEKEFRKVLEIEPDNSPAAGMLEAINKAKE